MLQQHLIDRINLQKQQEKAIERLLYLYSQTQIVNQQDLNNNVLLLQNLQQQENLQQQQQQQHQQQRQASLPVLLSPKKEVIYPSLETTFPTEQNQQNKLQLLRVTKSPSKPSILLNKEQKKLNKISLNQTTQSLKKVNRLIDPQNRTPKQINDTVDILIIKQEKSYHCCFPNCSDNKGKGWTLKLRCKTHIEAEHLGLKYKCPFCPFMSSRDDNLPKHVEKRHKNRLLEFHEQYLYGN